ncbi:MULTISPECIES: uridine kinase [unclassified Agarivorans]|uniref:uridine kinase n=1 Tax=unclassified Agarivorans TaxID=2636026 RepID=UPI0010DCC6FC|nr:MULTISPECIES: uridine kinase [unclassified Agarivorans]MDO6686017.1 uridine kinase [Agarivorans sp. 3_MG-2023]MDO6713845.1 uridine kinase [Agarivorans sp. 2_MG-2023]GDY25714.1 uridine kinase [Agarivorans sp. Toyoura001]
MKNQDHNIVVIGISGASASGKSLFSQTIVNDIRNELGDDCIAVINEDSYYNDQSHITPEERKLTNYDHPKSMDHALLVNHLKQLKQGQAIQQPQYSYKVNNRMDETKTVEPTKIVVLEGILLFTDPAIREQLDISIFVDTPLDICLARRIQRDVKERGRTLDSVLSQYNTTVRPMFLQFVEPSKQYADVIVPRGGKNRIAIDIINAKIRHLLAS